METPTPATDQPVAISGSLMAVVTSGFGLAVLLGVPLTAEQVGGFVLFIGAVIAFVTGWQRNRVTPNSRVLERTTPSGFVIAGEANEMVDPGTRIRSLGEPAPQGE